MSELVGDDGHEIADFMFGVLSNAKERTSDRMEAAKWLADRGFGKAALEVEAEDEAVTVEALMALLSGYSTQDLETLRDIHMKYVPDAVRALETSGELLFGAG